DGFDAALDEAMKKQDAERAYREPTGAVTVAKFDAALKWLVKRTNALYRALEDDYMSGATRQDENGKIIPIASKSDVENAKDYYIAVRALSDQWHAQRNKFLEEGQDPKEAIVDP